MAGVVARAPMSDLHVVILAAGKGTRMKSEVPKVLHRIAGLALIDFVLRTAAALNPRTTTVVIGHGADRMRQHLSSRPDVRTVVQEPQLGTGHALLQTAPLLRDQQGTIVLLSGDVPLLKPATLRNLVATHEDSGALATVLTAIVERPYGYGRIVRTQGNISRIVEERDASAAQREIKEINSGIYAFAVEPLFDALEQIGADNAQGEYYLPDLIGIYRKRRKVVATYTIEHASEIRGINSRSELAEVSAMVRQQKNEELMAAGVTLIDPATTYIDVDVEIAADTVIHPCVFIEGSTKIGAACEIHAGSRIVNSTIGDRVVILNHTVISDSTVAEGASIGPFAHLRPGNDIGEKAKIGNFVELKKTRLGPGQQGQSPLIPGRCHDRRKRQCWRGHHYVQLRRHGQAPHGHRGWRFCRERYHAGCTGHCRGALLHRGRVDDHRRCPARRARNCTRPPGKQARMGGKARSAVVFCEGT
jgi:bifunctional UDP-N-acetylglucosamine pyrophosphorylase/glucosamine-1-phosphate N-acetyltransferase